MELIEVMRVQRHDFMNHLQVISGLLQLGKHDKARDYIYKISEEMAREGLVTRLAYQGVAEVIIKHRYEAAKDGIEFTWNINSEFKKIQVPEKTMMELIDTMLTIALKQALVGGLGKGGLEISLLENEKGHQVKCSWHPGKAGEIAGDKKQFLAELAQKNGAAVNYNEEGDTVETAILFPIG